MSEESDETTAKIEEIKIQLITEIKPLFEQDKLIKKLEDLKFITKCPRLYLSDYFSELRNQIDLVYVSRQTNTSYNREENDKEWLEIINRVETFEQECQKKITFKKFKINNLNRIELIEEKIRNLNENSDVIEEMIQKEKSEIEKILFLNKTVLFLNSENYFFDYNECDDDDDDYYYDDYYEDENENDATFSDDEVSEVNSDEDVEYYDAYNNQFDTIPNDNTTFNDHNNYSEGNESYYNLEYLLLYNQAKLIIVNDEFIKKHDSNLSIYTANSTYRVEDSNIITEDFLKISVLIKEINKLEDIEKNIFELDLNLIQLVSLDFSRKNIISIENDLFSNKFPNLLKLEMYNNKLEKLEENMFNGLINLQVLNLKWNKILSIDANTFKSLIKLEFLDLSFNKFAVLNSSTFLELSSLKDLQLEFNQIECVGNIFQHQKKLEELNLSSNKIIGIDETTFQLLSNLKKLNLRRNQISKIDSIHFKSLTNLMVLDLGFNRINSIDGSSFNGLSNLVSLKLNNNNIVSIDSLTFRQLSNLKSLDLSHNELVTIDANIFNGLTNLEILKLHFNKVTVIDGNAFVKLINLKKILILPKLVNADFLKQLKLFCPLVTYCNLKPIE